MVNRTRFMAMDKAPVIDIEQRTVQVAFSSEEPVMRYFGLEVLDHSPESVDLSRLQDGAPVLLDHDSSIQIGVVESAEISADRRGRAVLRFSRSAQGDEVFNDLVDGIRNKISVGYQVHEINSEKQANGSEIQRVISWIPMEISVVSIPADFSVGVGRSFTNKRGKKMSEGTAEEKLIDQSGEVRKAEQERIREIIAMGRESGFTADADEYVDKGHSVQDFGQYVLRKMLERDTGRKQADTVQPIGLDQKEAKRYSFVRALAAMAMPQDRKIQEAAAFEREVSNEAARKSGFGTRGFLVPPEVLATRALNVTTATAGGNVVASELAGGSFIELLRNRLALSELGVLILSDLEGNVPIPKQTGTVSAAWLSNEGDDAPDSDAAFSQVLLAPKTYAVRGSYTRQLLMQSSIDIEQFVRSDITQAMARGLDYAAVYGTGVGGQPRGINNQTGINTVSFAAANPTFAEIVQLETEVASDNADIGSLGYLVSAAMRGYAKTTEKFAGSGATIWEPGETLNGYSAVVTNQIAAGDAIFGNFADLLLGFWGGLDIMSDPYTLANSGGHRVIAFQSADVAVRHPESFSVGRM